MLKTIRNRTVGMMKKFRIEMSLRPRAADRDLQEKASATVDGPAVEGSLGDAQPVGDHLEGMPLLGGVHIW